jgi:hypothetical protein
MQTLTSNPTLVAEVLGLVTAVVNLAGILAARPRRDIRPSSNIGRRRRSKRPRES